MLAAIALAIALATPTPAPPSPNPCAHRILCGPIRIVPRDPDARRAFVADIVASVADLVVTLHGTHGNSANEVDPFVRPFIRGGAPTIAFSWFATSLLTHATARTLHLDPTLVTDAEIGEHLSGTASWLSPATYAWMPNLHAFFRQPYVEALWIRYDTCGACR